MQRKWEKSRN